MIKKWGDVYLKSFILHSVLQIISIISINYLEYSFLFTISEFLMPILLFSFFLWIIGNIIIMLLFMIIAIFQFGHKIKQVILLFTVFLSITLFTLFYYSNTITPWQYPILFITNAIFLIIFCAIIKLLTLYLDKFKSKNSNKPI